MASWPKRDFRQDTASHERRKQKTPDPPPQAAPGPWWRYNGSKMVRHRPACLSAPQEPEALARTMYPPCVCLRCCKTSFNGTRKKRREKKNFEYLPCKEKNELKPVVQHLVCPLAPTGSIFVLRSYIYLKPHFNNHSYISWSSTPYTHQGGGYSGLLDPSPVFRAVVNTLSAIKSHASWNSYPSVPTTYTVCC